MGSNKYDTAFKLVKSELILLSQGCLIALFFFSITAIGSYSEIRGGKYQALFEALMGGDYLVMGALGYAILLGISGLIYSSAEDISQSKIGWYARAILIFPFIGFITPAFVFVCMNFFTTFAPTKDIENIGGLWFLLMISGVLAYAILCCLPFFLSFCAKNNLKKGIYFILLLSGIILSVFLTEKIFYDTTYMFYIFYASIFSIALLLIIIGTIKKSKKKIINENLPNV